jgi:kynureninase
VSEPCAAAARAGLFGEDEAHALALDRADPLSAVRAEFAVPPWRGGRHAELAYLAGSSLGLMPLAARRAVLDELDDWAELGVEGHSRARRPWLPYHEQMRETSARLVGARAGETVCMNTLTVNLHLMMATFYGPTSARHRIVIEDAAFPSDSYAVASQAIHHGLDPAEAIVRLRPREGEHALRTADVVSFLESEGHSVALVLLGGVNYFTGELVDIPAVTEATRAAGAVSGWDLAHAAGNVPLALHDWGVDWAAWCSYKYLNSGPGAIAGCFVHERHAQNRALPRLAGWWGNDPQERFRLAPVFAPQPGVEGWQVSNPPILSLAPVRVSLELFDRIGMQALRERSLRLTGYLAGLLARLGEVRPVRMITPRDPESRGCQLSVTVPGSAGELSDRLRTAYGVVCDEREPNVIRLAPTPLYNSFHDAWRAVAALAELVPSR